jgi:hypothetical protein
VSLNFVLIIKKQAVLIGGVLCCLWLRVSKMAHTWHVFPIEGRFESSVKDSH